MNKCCPTIFSRNHLCRDVIARDKDQEHGQFRVREFQTVKIKHNVTFVYIFEQHKQKDQVKINHKPQCSSVNNEKRV